MLKIRILRTLCARGHQSSQIRMSRHLPVRAKFQMRSDSDPERCNGRTTIWRNDAIRKQAQSSLAESMGRWILPGRGQRFTGSPHYCDNHPSENFGDRFYFYKQPPIAVMIIGEVRIPIKAWGHVNLTTYLPIHLTLEQSLRLSLRLSPSLSPSLSLKPGSCQLNNLRPKISFSLSLF